MHIKFAMQHKFMHCSIEGPYIMHTREGKRILRHLACNFHSPLLYIEIFADIIRVASSLKQFHGDSMLTIRAE